MLVKLRARAARIRLCSHIQCIATSVPFRRPRRPTARGYKLMHVHAQCLLSCAAARAPTIPTARTHLPSGTPTQSPQRQPVAKRHAQCPWHRRYATHTHTHRRRATTGCNPRETSLPMQAANNAGLTGAGPRRQPAREPAAAHHGSGRATPTATTTAPPACLSTHGTLAWGAEAARVRIPNGGAQRGGRRRRQGFC